MAYTSFNPFNPTLAGTHFNFPFKLHYPSSPPSPIFFTLGQHQSGFSRITRKTCVDGIVNHLPGTVVEMPVSGNQMGAKIAHIFPVDPTRFIHPKDNIQYSLNGSKHNRQMDGLCLFLRDKDTGEPVECEKRQYTCGSTKICSFNQASNVMAYNAHVCDIRVTCNTWHEVFLKTLGFFCALQDHGCAFLNARSEFLNEDFDSDSESQLDSSDSVPGLVLVKKDCRSPRKDRTRRCTGTLLLEQDGNGRFFIRCELYSKGQRNHLWLRNLGEYDMDYLVALFTTDVQKIWEYESKAASEGFGPLVACNVTTVKRAQKEFCCNWHRDSRGILQRGEMIVAPNCPTRFDIFKPLDLKQCPFVLIISTNPHSHPDPQPTKTPATIHNIFESLLTPLDWRLADATPRRILLDHSFMQNLREILGWTNNQDPTLGNLHPSLANYDHTARLINKLREQKYSSGTGLEGAKRLMEEHSILHPDKQYLRQIETYNDLHEGSFTIVICMFPQMSYLLLQAERLTIDTSFKRLHKWQEFEMEAWFPEYERSIVVARAFTTSESAIAHLNLFKLIFDIVETDTGQTIQFRHIHGCGIDTITADGHRGQALGLGLYLQAISKGMHGYCSIVWNRPLHALSPREHLMRFYRCCITHYARNVSKLKSHVSEQVLSAMMSLASTEPLPDLNTTLTLIRSGGKKAVDWLKDKQTIEGFYPLGAIYWPESYIPLDSWRAAPSTSNGNEQAHRNINRDGTRLTMLAGIMHGLQFDTRAISDIKFYTDDGIQRRDQSSNHFRRLLRSIKVKSSSQQKSILAKDNEIERLMDKTTQLQASISSAADSLKRCQDDKKFDRQTKRLRKCEEDLQLTNERLSQLIPQGSGLIPVPKLEFPVESSIKLALQSEVGPSDITSAPTFQTGITYDNNERNDSGFFYAGDESLYNADGALFNNCPPSDVFYSSAHPTFDYPPYEYGYFTSNFPSYN